MGQVTLHWKKDGESTQTYLIEGALSVRERKTQSSINLPFPLLADNATIINSIFGQVRVFVCAFIMTQRTDDYTNGTGSPIVSNPYEQARWLFDNIFKPDGYHELVDEEGTVFNGRIEDLEIAKAGDDPVKDDAVFTFKRGIVPIAGQFTPF